ncbi:MAG: hypothetical protein C0459_05440 [Chitinophaga sp.]|nr:hypothetical protein [Chitinophaga sp.]
MLNKERFQFLKHYKHLHFGKQTPEVESFLLPAGMKVTGDITGECKGRLDGFFNGKINISDKLIIGKKAVVSGYFFASEIMIFGQVEGEIFSKGKVSIMNGALVSGDVFANNFIVEENATVEGNLKKQSIEDLLKIFAAKHKHLGLGSDYDQEITQDGELILSLPEKIKITSEKNADTTASNNYSTMQRTTNRWF